MQLTLVNQGDGLIRFLFQFNPLCVWCHSLGGCGLWMQRLMSTAGTAAAILPKYGFWIFGPNYLTNWLLSCVAFCRENFSETMASSPEVNFQTIKSHWGSCHLAKIFYWQVTAFKRPQEGRNNRGFGFQVVFWQLDFWNFVDFIYVYSSGGDSWLFNLKLPPHNHNQLSAIIFSLFLKITNATFNHKIPQFSGNSFEKTNVC